MKTLYENFEKYTKKKRKVNVKSSIQQQPKKTQNKTQTMYT